MTRRKRLPLTGAGVALAAGLTLAGGALAGEPAAGASATPASSPPIEGQAFVPGELLVRFRGETSEREYDLPAEAGVQSTARALERNPRIRWAVPNYVARASGRGWIPNDRGERDGSAGGWQELQWHFLPCGTACGEESGGAFESAGGIDAPGAWENLIEVGRPGGRGVRVAVIDTGVAHRKRGGRFRRSPDLRRGQFAPGRDYVEGDRVPLDENGHGTHVASTIGERTDNRKFVTGLAYGAELIPIRVLDEHGEGRSSDVARGIKWAYRRRADVINLSLEFPRKVEGCNEVPGVCAAIDRAHAKGAVVIAAAGNGGLFGKPSVDYPARAPNVIAVGATTERGCLADYSHFGKGLDVTAPGGGFDTVDAGGQCESSANGRGVIQLTLTKKGSGRFTRFGYPFYEGTSMASAHAAGTAALVWAALEGRLGREPTPGEVEARLESTARADGDLGDPNLYGAGLLDAAAATAP
jgi:serine protease